MLTLIKPVVEFEGINLKSTYDAYINELENEERYPYPMDLDHEDFVSFVALLNDYSKGQNLPDFLVPNTTFWLIQDNEIVACSHLRHTLNKQLTEAGGHIGFGVRPSYRGKGLGKVLLEQTLQQAKLNDINAVHIHCYASNLASVGLIKSVGANLIASRALSQEKQTLLKFIYHQAL
ncbi:GNAT family N-acetyltransferase [Glaciecola petra]|uniref:GNAT family N-acetyltransferase n=1 Tax=Glaciecola petra TaxID=3075602 RepID=A0ABU2ZQE3_9ALTE|nr:GNAT family N-acetyltransferase [Aestuariibacter sp. P117]MDT0594843.1 GNAT family N-acetyltransferase [Aestuariibacter sp. P117]